MKTSFLLASILFLTPALIWSADANLDRKQGFRFYASYQADSTLKYLVPLYQASPKDDSLGLAIAEASLWKKDYRTATTVITNLQQAQNPEALRIKGLLLEQAGRLPEALAAYDQAILKHPKPWGSMERRAQVLAWLGKRNEAKQQIQQVLKSKEPSDGLRVRCYLDLALWTAWDKEFDEAAKQLRNALAIDSKSIEGLLLLGQIHEWKGEFILAKKVYGQILSIDDKNAEARLRLGKLQWVQ